MLAGGYREDIMYKIYSGLYTAQNISYDLSIA
jgi:hypothetical protein